MIILPPTFIPSSNLETISKETKTYSYKFIKRILITSRFIYLFFCLRGEKVLLKYVGGGGSDICWLSTNTGISHVDSKDTSDIIKRRINLSKLIKVSITLN